MTEPSVRYLDLGREYAEIGPDVLRAMRATMERGNFVLGPELETFEAEFAAYCGASYAVGVDSGTGALALSLRALGIGAGDEVITQPNTFIATVAAIVSTGARPVFADLAAPTYAIDPDHVKRAISSRTRAIVPVHMFGQPADLPALEALCRTSGIAMIEDASQAHGARIAGRKIGSGSSTAVCFSFYPSKNLGAYGEGGAVVTSDEAMAARLRSLRNHGATDKFHHREFGFNARLDELQAAVLRVKLPHLESWNERRRAIAAHYDARLRGVERPLIPSAVVPSRHVYPVFIDHRDRVRALLAERGVETNIHYPVPCHLEVAASSLGYREGDFPVAERLAACELSLPISPWVEVAVVDRVCDVLAECVALAAETSTS